MGAVQCSGNDITAPNHVALQHINFCIVQSISKLPMCSPKMMPIWHYHQHFTMFPLNGHYNHHLRSSFLQHSHTSAFGAAIAGNSSGTRFLFVTLREFPFLPEPSSIEVKWGLQEDLTHSHSSAICAAIAGNSSGSRVWEGPSTEGKWVPFKQDLTVGNKESPIRPKQVNKENAPSQLFLWLDR
ncbi:hypothetical protein TNCV_2701271 [Trichonephila clavipes]|nr:hypothetical protein TNCV_2701271 [Trichonephila clavipes]